MAVVTSLTVEKIQELMAGFNGIALSQEEILALITQLIQEQESNNHTVQDLNDNVIPDALRDIANSRDEFEEFYQTTVVDVLSDLEDAKNRMEDITTIDIPSLRDDLANEMINSLERPKVYVQETAPENPDEEDRYLVRGDVWYNSADDNRQRIWDGVSWTTFAIDISDFSLTVKKFISNRHQLY